MAWHGQTLFDENPDVDEDAFKVNENRYLLRGRIGENGRGKSEIDSISLESKHVLEEATSLQERRVHSICLPVLSRNGEGLRDEVIWVLATENFAEVLILGLMLREGLFSFV